MVSFAVLTRRNSLGFHGGRDTTYIVEALQYQLLRRRVRHFEEEKKRSEPFKETQTAAMTQETPGDDDP